MLVLLKKDIIIMYAWEDLSIWTYNRKVRDTEEYKEFIIIRIQVNLFNLKG